MKSLARFRSLFFAIGAIGLVAAACGGDDDTTANINPTAALPTTAAGATTAPTSAATAAPTAASGDSAAVVQVRDVGSLGKVLVSPAGLTLYTFKSDTPNSGKSACSGGCATVWPPLMATNADQASGDWTVVVRDDGSRQWAYKGRPLHFYQQDKKAGDRNGDGIGGVWHAVKQ